MSNIDTHFKCAPRVRYEGKPVAAVEAPHAAVKTTFIPPMSGAPVAHRTSKVEFLSSLNLIGPSL
jgi:hypothetical protein